MISGAAAPRESPEMPGDRAGPETWNCVEKTGTTGTPVLKEELFAGSPAWERSTAAEAWPKTEKRMMPANELLAAEASQRFMLIRITFKWTRRQGRMGHGTEPMGLVLRR